MSDTLRGCAIHNDSSKQEIQGRLERVFKAPYDNELKIKTLNEWLFQSERDASLKPCSRCEVSFYQITLMKEWLEKETIAKNCHSDTKQEDIVNKLAKIIQDQAKLISQCIGITSSNNITGISCCVITKTFNQSFTVMKNNFGQVGLEAKMNVFAVVTFFLTNPNVRNNLCKECEKYLGALGEIFEKLRKEIVVSKKTPPQPEAKKTSSNPQPQNQPQPKAEEKIQTPSKWTGADFKKATPGERMEWIKAIITKHSNKQLTFKLVINKQKCQEKYDFFNFSVTHEGGDNVAPRLISYGSRQFCFSGVVDYSVKEIINWVSIHYEKNVFINIMLHYPKECHTKEHQEHIEEALEKLREQLNNNIDFKVNIPYDKIT